MNAVEHHARRHVLVIPARRFGLRVDNAIGAAQVGQPVLVHPQVLHSFPVRLCGVGKSQVHDVKARVLRVRVRPPELYQSDKQIAVMGVLALDMIFTC